MKLPKTFIKLSQDERIKYAMRKKKFYEDKERFWTAICRKLATNKDFTPMEMEIIDILLNKESE